MQLLIYLIYTTVPYGVGLVELCMVALEKMDGSINNRFLTTQLYYV